jgi:phospholipid/cholesterol/gamma-HCH transport system substrate-binding protein
MKSARCRGDAASAVIFLGVSLTLSGCGWHGVNSLPLPGTEGGGPGSYTIQIQMPDIGTMQQNTRVRVNDVNVGTVTNIARQGWHALVTVRLGKDVDLPANATAKIGQTSLLGSVHLELAAPTDVVPQGTLHNGSLIPLSSSGSYPTTEQTLASVSMLLNGGGLGHVQEITQAFSTAFAGRSNDLRSLITQLDTFIGRLKDQTDEIVRATDSLDAVVGQFAAEKPVVDVALRTIPDALAVLNDHRDNLIEALDQLGKISALIADTTNQSNDAIAANLRNLAPVVASLADAGPALTRSLSFLATFPWIKENIPKWVRGDYANLTAVADLTLSRFDAGFLTGTRFEGDLTKLEMQWGRTIGVMPSPYTAGNPLIAPYVADQGP